MLSMYARSTLAHTAGPGVHRSLAAAPTIPLAGLRSQYLRHTRLSPNIAPRPVVSSPIRAKSAIDDNTAALNKAALARIISDIKPPYAWPRQVQTDTLDILKAMKPPYTWPRHVPGFAFEMLRSAGAIVLFLGGYALLFAVLIPNVLGYCMVTVVVGIRTLIASSPVDEYTRTRIEEWGSQRESWDGSGIFKELAWKYWCKYLASRFVDTEGVRIQVRKGETPARDELENLDLFP